MAGCCTLLNASWIRCEAPYRYRLRLPWWCWIHFRTPSPLAPTLAPPSAHLLFPPLPHYQRLSAAHEAAPVVAHFSSGIILGTAVAGRSRPGGGRSLLGGDCSMVLAGLLGVAR